MCTFRSLPGAWHPPYQVMGKLVQHWEWRIRSFDGRPSVFTSAREDSAVTRLRPLSGSSRSSRSKGVDGTVAASHQPETELLE